jgi:predicted P-loop ATPase
VENISTIHPDSNDAKSATDAERETLAASYASMFGTGFADGKPAAKPDPERVAKAKPAPQQATHTRRGEANPAHAWASSLYKTVIDEEPNVANLSLVLAVEHQFRGKFGYDELLCSEMMMGNPPLPVEDSDVIQFQAWLQAQGFRRAAKGTVHDAVGQVCRSHPYHPIRQYLGELTWDGTPRLDTWLSTYVGAEESEYHSRVGRMFLISMIARVMRPGCKCDYMLVLDGPQGSRKSTACKILAGESWFSDKLPDISDKDAQQHLAGKWLIEIAELSAMSKADTNTLKSFITRTEEKYRPAYGRRDVHQPRQCVFIGTTNQQTYLRDETGGRRFWPVKIGIIDTDRLAADRGMLFAEALTAYRQDEPWWPDQVFEQVHIQPEQESRFDADAWEDIIRESLAAKVETTVADVGNALGIPKRDLDTVKQKRITAVLRRLGWERHRTKVVRLWRRTDLQSIAEAQEQAKRDAAKGLDDIPIDR